MTIMEHALIKVHSECIEYGVWVQDGTSFYLYTVVLTRLYWTCNQMLQVCL